MKKFLIIFVVFFFLSPSLTTAADTVVSASLKKNALSLRESTVFSITVTGTANADAPEVPQLDFARLQYVGPSTQIRFVNGQSSSQITFQYYLTPLKEGAFSIPSVTMTVGGKNYTTEPCPFQVYKAGGAGAHGDSGSQESEAAEEDVIVETEIDSRQVYVDQQILLTLRIFTKESSRNIASVRHSLPSLEAFIVENTAEKKQRYVTRNAQNYLLTEYKWILFPTREGEYTVPPVEASYYRLVKRKSGSRRRSPFDDDFFSNNFMSPFFSGSYDRIPMQTFSDPLTFRVLPLPEEGKPASFFGTVGSYEMDVQISPEKGYQVGAPINFTVTISGVGHISSIAEAEFTGEESFRIFPPETTSETEKLENIQRGKKIFKKVFIPKEEGELLLPRVAFTYFDPILKSYQTLEKGGKKIFVKKGETTALILPSSHESYPKSKNGKKVDYKGFDIITVKDTLGNTVSSLPDKTRIPVVLLFLYPILIISGELWGHMRQKRLRDPLALRSRKAFKIFKKNIRALELLLNGKSEEFYKKKAWVLRCYLSDRIGLPSGGITADIIESHLIPAGVDAETARTLKFVFERIDTAMYGIGKDNAATRKEEIDHLGKIVAALEKYSCKRGEV